MRRRSWQQIACRVSAVPYKLPELEDTTKYADDDKNAGYLVTELS